MASYKRLSAAQLEKDGQLLVASTLNMLKVGDRVAIQRHVRLFVSEFVADAVVRVIGGTFADVEVDGKLYRYMYPHYAELYTDGATPRLQNTRLFKYVR